MVCSVKSQHTQRESTQWDVWLLAGLSWQPTSERVGLTFLLLRCVSQTPLCDPVAWPCPPNFSLVFAWLKFRRRRCLDVSIQQTKTHLGGKTPAQRRRSAVISLDSHPASLGAEPGKVAPPSTSSSPGKPFMFQGEEERMVGLWDLPPLSSTNLPSFFKSCAICSHQAATHTHTYTPRSFGSGGALMRSDHVTKTSKANLL